VKLRTALLIGTLALIAGILTATVVSVSLVVDNSARTEVRDDVIRASNVFGVLYEYRNELYQNEALVIAESVRMNAAIKTQDHATVLDQAETMKRARGSDVFLVTDEEGFLIADAAHPGDEGIDMSANSLIAAAIKRESASGTWTTTAEGEATKAFQVQARLVKQGEQAIGVLVIGHLFGDATPTAVHQQTGSSVAVMLDGRAVAVSTFRDGRDTDREALAKALEGVPDITASPVSVEFDGIEYLAMSGGFPGYTGDSKFRYVVLRNLDEALAPGRRIKYIMYIVVGISVLLAILLAMLISGRLSSPLAELVEFTKRIAAGDLSQTARVRGVTETRTLGEAMNRMVRELDESRAAIAEKQRLEGELEIAERIQTSILPRNLSVASLEIAARMVPADEVGGDYYDVLEVDGGAWIAIGDVSGHGLESGLIMMMVQTGVASLVRANPDGSPAEIVRELNRVIYENVANRMEVGRHMTLTLIRFHDDGRVVFAGAHMDIALLRAGTAECEAIRTPGTWVGIVDDVDSITEDTQEQLQDGDLMVLYTDGVTEAMDASGDQFGFKRLCGVVEDVPAKSSQEVCSALFAAVQDHTDVQQDDISALVMRYRRKP
jgi:serine phosphatase RsbU (regulator of sigma subunit)